MPHRVRSLVGLCFSMEILMYVPRGYRAREAAAKARNNRKLVSEEVRAARAAVLPGFADQATEVEVEVQVTAEELAAKEAASKEAAEKEAAEQAAAEAAEKEAAEQAAADAEKAKAKQKTKAK